jgi:hypothetical protein
MTGGVDVLSAEMAHKVHIDAINRDYICEPRLGAQGALAAPRAVWLRVQPGMRAD